MQLLDNFRVLLLLGLIAASGISSVQGKACNMDGAHTDCEDNSLCLLDKATGNEMGCIVADENPDDTKNKCGDPATLTDVLQCQEGAENCCCKAGDTNACNDMTDDKSEAKKKICELKEFKDLDACKAFAGEGGGDGSGQGGLSANAGSDEKPVDWSSGMSITASCAMVMLMASFAIYSSQDVFRTRA